MIATQNLLIPQGDDFEFKISFHHGTQLLCDALPSTVPAKINIAPIGATMLAGQKLFYGGCGELILSAPIAPTDLTAMVTKIPAKIAKDTSLRGNPIDVTGWTGFSSIRSNFGEVLSWDGICTIDSALSGTFSVLFPRAVTRLIPANCSAAQLSVIQDFSMDDAATWGKLIKQSYYWDFDTIATNNRRTRRTEGRALVSSEVTV